MPFRQAASKSASGGKRPLNPRSDPVREGPRGAGEIEILTRGPVVRERRTLFAACHQQASTKRPARS